MLSLRKKQRVVGHEAEWLVLDVAEPALPPTRDYTSRKGRR